MAYVVGKGRTTTVYKWGVGPTSGLGVGGAGSFWEKYSMGSCMIMGRETVWWRDKTRQSSLFAGDIAGDKRQLY